MITFSWRAKSRGKEGRTGKEIHQNDVGSVSFLFVILDISKYEEIQALVVADACLDACDGKEDCPG